ncbi:MAG: hypothetical protein AB7P76_06955 [Candidatus Melainabacteria bacterium]
MDIGNQVTPFFPGQGLSKANSVSSGNVSAAAMPDPESPEAKILQEVLSGSPTPVSGFPLSSMLSEIFGMIGNGGSGNDNVAITNCFPALPSILGGSAPDPESPEAQFPPLGLGGIPSLIPGTPPPFGSLGGSDGIKSFSDSRRDASLDAFDADTKLTPSGKFELKGMIAALHEMDSPETPEATALRAQINTRATELGAETTSMQKFGLNEELANNYDSTKALLNVRNNMDSRSAEATALDARIKTMMDQSNTMLDQLATIDPASDIRGLSAPPDVQLIPPLSVSNPDANGVVTPPFDSPYQLETESYQNLADNLILSHPSLDAATKNAIQSLIDQRDFFGRVAEGPHAAVFNDMIWNTASNGGVPAADIDQARKFQGAAAISAVQAGVFAMSGALPQGAPGQDMIQARMDALEEAKKNILNGNTPIPALAPDQFPGLIMPGLGGDPEQIGALQSVLNNLAPGPEADALRARIAAMSNPFV